ETGAHIGPSDVTHIGTPEDFLSGSSTVYVRVENSFTDTSESCYVVVLLELVVNPWPNIGPMTNLPACMEEPTTSTKFNLHDKDELTLTVSDLNYIIIRYLANK